eukprot:gene309-781_t
MEGANLEESFKSLFQIRDEMMSGLKPFVEMAQWQKASSSFLSPYHSDSESESDTASCCSGSSGRSSSSVGSNSSGNSLGKAFGLFKHSRRSKIPRNLSMTPMDLGKAFMFPTLATWSSASSLMAGATVGGFSTVGKFLPLAAAAMMPQYLPNLATAFVNLGGPYQMGFSQSAALTAALLYIFGLKGLSQHETAGMGNWLGILASALAILSVIFGPAWTLTDSIRFFIVFALSSGVGRYAALSVEMENMPELVAGFHSFVGLAAVFTGFATFFGHWTDGTPISGVKALETAVGVGVGAFTFTGSVAAAGKLAGKIPGRPIDIPLRAVQVSASALLGLSHGWQLLALGSNCLIASYFGVITVLPVGGADMPIIVSLLNSISGIATSSAGFMLDSSLLVISGAVIASSGAFLSQMMCKGINRSLPDVLLGGFGVESGTVVASAPSDDGPKELREITPQKLGEKLAQCKRVLIVPGYGMAVSRCQAKIAEIAVLLKRCGISVSFGVHPVAGRLPGHMNVLLAEADVPYDFVKEMDEVNPKIQTYDLGIVVGANDIVNPATASDPTSPIYGMPAIEIWKCKECVVLKRSMATGYSGVQNPLFFMPNVSMCFGDAKNSVEKVASTLSDLEETLAAKHFAAQAQGTVSDDEPDHEDQHPVVYPEIVKTLGVVTETFDDRVSITPKLVTRLRNMGFGLCIQEGAGNKAGFTDESFMVASRGKNSEGVDAGIEYVSSMADVYEKSEVLLFVSSPTNDEISLLQPKHTLLCLFNMYEKEELLEQALVVLPRDTGGKELLANDYVPREQFDASWTKTMRAIGGLKATGATVINMGLVPRISRAQKLDALTSMANIAGYRAVVEAFHTLPRFSRASATASGHIAPSKILIVGAGVAGLSAIATAHALGAEVYATDVRSAAREQDEAMGAKFVEPGTVIAGEGAGGYASALSKDAADLQRQMYAKVIKKMDVVVSTALIPSRKAPLIITSDMVRSMKPGGVMVDLAAPGGGNCELTVPDETIVDAESHVTIIGPCNFAEQMPAQASDLLGSNFVAMLDTIGGATDWNLDFSDPVIQKSTVTFDGKIVYDPTPLPQPKQPAKPELAPGENDHRFFCDYCMLTRERSFLKEHERILATGLQKRRQQTFASTKETEKCKMEIAETTKLVPYFPHGNGPAGFSNIFLNCSICNQSVAARFLFLFLFHPLFVLSIIFTPLIEKATELTIPPEVARSNFDIVIDFLNENSEMIALALGLGASFTIGIFLPQKDLHHLGYFMLSVLVGHFTVARVNPALHTPLIAVTNAISGIIVVGGMLQIGGDLVSAHTACALLAVFFGATNVVGGFTVTHRMLGMFRNATKSTRRLPAIPSVHA